MMVFDVRPIPNSAAREVMEAKHYSRRGAVIWEAFGLYRDDILVGVVCYGQPSAPISKHAFFDRDFRLYELTRLVVDDGIPNGASILIGRSLQMLSHRPCAVISYADSANGHAGIVYQATNWVYTGATVSHDSLYLVNGVPTHPMTLRDRGITSPAKWAKENAIETVKPSPKHRYFFFVGAKKERKKMLGKLAYPVVSPYPKMDKNTYDAGLPCAAVTQIEIAFREKPR